MEVDRLDQNILAKLKEIVCERLAVAPEQVLPESELIDDLGADSLDIVDMAMALESSFDVEIPDEDCERLLTVGAVVECLQELQLSGT